MTLALLEGIRVVALEQYIAGPYCTSMLADAGAEVIKVEQPGVGDPRRSYTPVVDNGEQTLSAGFAPFNRGKRSVELDVHAEQERFTALLATADVLVCNLRPGTLQRAGWSRDRLRAEFPRLVVCELTGFGTTGGPQAEWPAFDSVVQAMSGLSSLIGDSPDTAPGLTPMSTTDMLAGIYAAFGILAALVRRSETGEGCHVDAAMLDIGAAFLVRPLAIHELTGEVPTRGADRHSPVGAFAAGDGGWVSIVIPTDVMWARTCAVINRPELVDDPVLGDSDGRAGHMWDLVLPALTAWASTMSAEDAVRLLRDGGQPAGEVQTIAQVRASPQLAARGLFLPMAGFDDVAFARLPLLFDGEGADRDTVPVLGEDTADVLGPWA